MKHRQPKRLAPRLVAAAVGIPALLGAAGVIVATTASAQPTAPSASVRLTSSAPQWAPGRVVARFRSGVSHAAQAALEHANGASVISTIGDVGATVLQVPVGAEAHVVTALQRSGKVEYAERDGVVQASQTPNDYWWPSEWGPVKVNAPTAWNTTTGSSSVTIAVLDTGVDFTQPDLQGAFVPGYDFVNNDTDPTDDHGHGTMTAGVAGARTNNSSGVASYCWTCSIMPVKVLDSSGGGTMDVVAKGVTWATDHGARVISMSLGGQTSSSALQAAVSYAENHGVVVVAAAGNYSTSTPVYPAAYAGVLGVAGTDGNDALYSWSSYGSWVAVSGPGCNYTTGRSSWYGNFCGTSSATPAVAGVVGLLAAAAPSATASQIVSALESSAVSVGSFVKYGRVDATAALSALGASSSTTTSPSPTPTATSTATASPSPTATSSPSPSSTSTTGSVTVSGTLSSRHPSVSTTVSAGSGALVGTASFTKASSVTLTVTDSAGNTVASGSGGSPLSLRPTVASGNYTVTVTGPMRASVSLTVTYTTP